MDSNPPLTVEDLTDEDFFNNLVEDDLPGEESSSSFAQQKGGSDVVKNLANVSIGDGNTGIEELNDYLGFTDSHAESKAGTVHEYDDDGGGINPSPVSSSGRDDSRNVSNTVTSISSNAPDLSASKSTVSEKPGCKEVQWSSYFADSSNIETNGGPYSDFFCGLETNAGDLFAPQGTASREAVKLTGYEGLKTGDIHSSCDTEFEESKVCADHSQWDNIYPGWKFDEKTGQWYQFDGYNEVSTETTISGVASEWEANSHYSQENVQYSGSEIQSLTMDSHENLNKHLTAGVYPDHIIIDPQYPGWCYDTISQEWRELESVYPAPQSNNQSHVVPEKNGAFIGSETRSFDSHHRFHDPGAYPKNQVTAAYYENTADDSYARNIGSNAHQTAVVQEPSERRQNGWWDGSYNDNTNTNSGFPGLNESNVKQHQADFAHVSHLSSHADQWRRPFQEEIQKVYETSNGVMSIPPTSVQGDDFIGKSMTTRNSAGSVSNPFQGNQQAMGFAYQQPSSSQTPEQLLGFSKSGRSTEGRPPHALVTFGFGGKLVVMRDDGSIMNPSYGSADSGGQSVSILNLMEVAATKVDSGHGTSNYFRSLCQQSFPGPLIGCSVGSREVNKWIDERIARHDDDSQNGESSTSLLLSLLKISYQNYGKLRSPFGSSTASGENDSPESAVAKLFASVKMRNNEQYGSRAHCLKRSPSEEQLQASASEVQRLLVSGRTTEALHSAQEGQLWGPALVLAAQLGDQFYADTVRRMALHQLVAGSPLRTLCLLVAGQPADVFSADATVDNVSHMQPSLHHHHHHHHHHHNHEHSTKFSVNGMLDDWEENLAVIAANRTKGDELVIVHLGDCLWKDRAEVAAAHICYLVAEANFEPYSDSARLCLIGADHWKCPRTFASPEAIQRTELYEYSKVQGNSQFTLLPFQPYKLLYAHMLAEVGKLSDAVKYCQSALRSLRTAREPEAETWKSLLISLEDRARVHLQAGSAATKLVGKLLNFFDNTAHRVVGGLPPPVPSAQNQTAAAAAAAGSRVLSSQSTMAMSSLVPSVPKPAEGTWKPIHGRSVSEPDFGRTAPTSNGGSVETSAAGLFRFGFGTQIIQKTFAFVLNRPDRQAKLGEENKFYYDPRLNTWVEHGSEPSALSPPPVVAAPATLAEMSPGSNGSGPKSGTPPIIPSSRFSAVSRTSVRSRYVDTFNQGAGGVVPGPGLFQSPPPPIPAAQTVPKFFMPAAPPAEEAGGEQAAEEESVPSVGMVRFSSTGNMLDLNGDAPTVISPHSRRTASWGGSPNGGPLTADPPPPRLQMDRGGFGDDLHEVEL